MFVTDRDWEQWVPKELGPEGCRYWRAVALATELPWYFMTHLETEGGNSVCQTTVVTWETTLRSLLEQLKPNSLLSAHWVTRSRDREYWQVRRISEVWIPADDEIGTTGPLLFKLYGEPSFFDSHNDRAADSNAHRRLLVRIPT